MNVLSFDEKRIREMYGLHERIGWEDMACLVKCQEHFWGENVNKKKYWPLNKKGIIRLENDLFRYGLDSAAEVLTYHVFTSDAFLKDWHSFAEDYSKTECIGLGKAWDGKNIGGNEVFIKNFNDFDRMYHRARRIVLESFTEGGPLKLLQKY